MTEPRGPIGTGERFKTKVAKLVSKGKTDLQARRIASISGNENAKRK